MLDHYCSYCMGLLSKYKHGTFLCTALLFYNIEGTLQSLLLVVYARISFMFLKKSSVSK